MENANSSKSEHNNNDAQRNENGDYFIQVHLPEYIYSELSTEHEEEE